MKRTSRQCYLAVLLATTSSLSTAFVPSSLPSSLRQRPLNVDDNNGVDCLKQTKAADPGLRQHHAMIPKWFAVPSKNRRSTVLTQNRECWRSSIYDETDHEFVTRRKFQSLFDPPCKAEYKVINPPQNDQQTNQKKKKSKSSNRLLPPSSTSTSIQRKHDQQPQPEWVLQFSAAQREVEQLKYKIQNFVNQPLVECLEAGSTILSSILVAVITLPNVAPEVLEPIEIVQQTLGYIFFAEFLTRWFSCTEKPGKYVIKPLVLIDLVVVVLPILLPLLAETPFPDFGQSGLITLRLLRILRLQRNLQDEMSFSKFLFGLQLNSSESVIVQEWELQLARVVLSVFTLLSVAAGLIYTTEHAVNPDIPDYFTALYFTLTTLTTVGFGDITPITWQGKLVVSGSILAGITVIPAQAATLVEALFQRGEQKEQLKREEQRRLESATKPSRAAVQPPQPDQAATLEPTQKCPTCGVGLHWSHANYCYSCASPLQPESTLVLTDLS